MAMNFSNEPILSPRIAMIVEYDGEDYFGWQIQKNPSMPSVQETLEKAVSVVANEPIHTYCAGRTDSGVHGTSQVVHFETSAIRSEKSWILGTNVNLPGNVVVRWAGGVPEDFHARFSATARTYRYIILEGALRTAVLHKKVTLVKDLLDIDAMQAAANYLPGENDFSAYRGAGCQSNTPFRFVDYIRVFREGNFVVTEISANAFLLHMVRNIMGVLIEIGLGRKPPVWAKEVLDSRDRKQAARTAPADGLYFVRAHYPSRFGVPELAPGPAFIPAGRQAL